MNRTWRWIEFAALFLALPVVLIFTEDVFPIIPTLIVLLGVVVVFLRLDGWSYRELSILGSARAWRNMVLLFVPTAVVLSLLAAYFIPDIFLSFPKSNPSFFILLSFLYPFLSALPQELFYRTYFFRRYHDLFGGNMYVLVVLSGLLFMWGHLLFMNPIALLSTFAGGLLFAWRFARTKSLLLVTVEHSLYGMLFFGLGFGRFLYSGLV